MHCILRIECAEPGVLWVNGQFCGPLGEDGQSFPASRDAEIYIQFFPFLETASPVTAALQLRGGLVADLQPQERAYALCWPDGVIELELRAGEGAISREETVAAGTLLRYLTAALAGDAQAQTLLMRAQDAPDLSAYEAVTPLRFAPMRAPARYDERAGLVRRLLPNAAAVDAAMGMTVSAGQGMRRIERIEIFRTGEGN